MKFSNEGVRALKHLEGEKLIAYQDSKGVWTIGVGHTGKVDGMAIRRDLKISPQKSTALLLNDIKQFEQVVNYNVRREMTQNQYDAFVIFAFNIGAKAFENSTALARFNRGDVKGAQEAMGWFNKVTIGKEKVTLPGLVNRRKAEQRIFGGGAYVETA